ncbi:MAG: hypothetical protein H7Z14_14215 [Anaerolineae bacterium]|nr:hypothetical protein [Phycisphaerae bacterium]
MSIVDQLNGVKAVPDSNIRANAQLVALINRVTERRERLNDQSMILLEISAIEIGAGKTHARIEHDALRRFSAG